MMPQLLSKPAKVAATAMATAVLAACGATNVAPIDPVANRICYPNPLFDNDNHPLLQVVANETLADLRLDVTDMFITNRIQNRPERRGRVLLPNEDRFITGYSAWAKVEQCENGQVIVQFDRNCRIQQVYTRYGCEVAGISSSIF